MSPAATMSDRCGAAGRQPPGMGLTAAAVADLTPRERELGAIIDAYNQVTEQLKLSHDRLGREVVRLREELADKNRLLRRRERLAALGGLAAGVAHEIRNPLGGIGLFASLLRRDLKDRPESLRVVDKIIKGVSSLESVVTDILEFGRPTKAVPGRVRLHTVVRETIELAAARSQRLQIEVIAERNLEDVELVTDAAMLQRALLNLLFNAIEAAAQSPPPRRVTVRLEDVDADYVALTVADSGPGIPEELLDRIFNPFFTTKDTGTGLGLSIVHQIAETLGGSVQAANRAGGGAVFTLRVARNGVQAGDE